jgi:putative ABC transport system permease protein
VAISAVWLWTLIQLPSARGNVRNDVLTVALGGMVLSVAAGWTAVRVLGPMVKLLDQSVGNAAIGAVLRPTAGYLSGERWRTGLTVLMFGMVVLIMVAALTLLHVVSNAYVGHEAPVAGYELRADLVGEPIADMEAALAEASAVGRDSFSAVGGVALQDVQSVQLGGARAHWQPATLAVADDGFLGGIEASLQRRAPNYANDQAVWAALQAQLGTAVVTARGLEQIDAIAGDDEDRMEPWTVWVRPQQGGQPIKLSVIGVVDARSELDDAIYTSRTTAAELHVSLAAPRTYFFAVQPGVRTTDAADGLQISFADRGIAVVNLGDQVRIIATVRLLLTRLVQGFMGLGLLAGVAALALLGGQAVIERRQQLGTLRVLGYTRWHIRAMLAIESAVIAALGISLGVVLGVFLARSVVTLLSTSYVELRYAVPWFDIGLIIAVAWLGSTLAMLVGAWYAGRVSPADALRSGS